MKRRVISEAINNISENYMLEAMELHNKEVVSDVNSMSTKNMRKKFVVIGVAAALSLALGVTAAAALRGMNTRVAEPDETVVIVYPEDTVEIVNESGNMEIFTSEEQVISYNNISRVISVDGPSECNEIEFMPTYLPENTVVNWGELNTWCDVAQGLIGPQEHAYNIGIIYSAQFADGGCMFIDDVIEEQEEETNGDFIITKLSGYLSFAEDINVYYYIMYNTVEGYGIVISSYESMESCENIANGLEIRTTGNVLAADDFDSNNLYLACGVG